MMSLTADLLHLESTLPTAGPCVAPRLRLSASCRRSVDKGDRRPFGTPQRRGNQHLRQGEHHGPSRSRSVRSGRTPMMLTNVVDAYLAKQRSLGMRFESAEVLLRRFCRAMGNRDIGEVTPGAVAEFLQGTGPLSATWMLRYRVSSGLYRFAVSRGYAPFSPLPTALPKLPPQQTPYVYSTGNCGACWMRPRSWRWGIAPRYQLCTARSSCCCTEAACALARRFAWSCKTL